MYIQALQIITSGLHTLRRKQAHDANSQMYGSDRTDSFGGELSFANFIIGGGGLIGEALEGGLELRARCRCDEGEAEEVG